MEEGKTNLTNTSVDGFNSKRTDFISLIPGHVLNRENSASFQNTLLLFQHVNVTVNYLVKHELLVKRGTLVNFSETANKIRRVPSRGNSPLYFSMLDSWISYLRILPFTASTVHFLSIRILSFSGRAHNKREQEMNRHSRIHMTREHQVNIELCEVRCYFIKPHIFTIPP